MSLTRRHAALASAFSLALGVAACTHPDLPTTGAGATLNGSGGTSSAPGGPGAGGGGGVTPGNGGGSGVVTPGEGLPTVTFDPTMMTPPPAVVDVCAAANYSDRFTPGQNVPAAPSDAEVQSVLNLMDLGERIKQLQGVDVNLQSPARYDDVQRSQDTVLLDATPIRGYFYRDAGRGVNLDARQQQREYVNNYSTVFPVASARGASFDLDLEYRIGEAIADETVASGNTMLLAPCMNILRHPFWGRAQETYGEDSFHLGRMASALTAGLQTNVAACAKHFAANNVEESRSTFNALMDEQTLREIYSRHFEMVIRDGGVACIMASYNSINGVKSTQNAHLLTDILRTDFGFQGLVLSDWWAMPGDQAAPSTQTAQSNAIGALTAGLDIEVPWTLNYGQLDELVDQGDVSADQINRAAARVIRQKARFNALYGNQPIGLVTPTTSMVQGSITDNDDHIALSREAAAKSMVLLKNDNAVLPIKTDGSFSKVAVVGVQRPYTVRSSTPQPGTQAASVINFPVDVNLGDRGSSRVNADPAKSIGPAAGLAQVASRYGIEVASSNDLSAAQDADFVVVVVGLTPEDEGEEYAIPGNSDRLSLSLPTDQDALVQAAVALQKPMVVVIESGSIVNMPWLSQVPAVVMAWYSGQQGGLALAQLLMGEENFSGKLPVSWFAEADLPVFKDSATATTMDYYLGYRLIDKNGLTPVFPFGHGLSYTSFSYANLVLGCPSTDQNGVVPVTVDVTNETATPGEETVLVFASFPQTAAPRRSVKELKAFAKVALGPNETRSVTIPLRVQDLKYWQGDESGQWVVESGPVDIRVGKSAADADLTLRQTINVL
jgi:beta-glucosidase